MNSNGYERESWRFGLERNRSMMCPMQKGEKTRVVKRKSGRDLCLGQSLFNERRTFSPRAECLWYAQGRYGKSEPRRVRRSCVLTRRGGSWGGREMWALWCASRLRKRRAGECERKWNYSEMITTRDLRCASSAVLGLINGMSFTKHANNCRTNNKTQCWSTLRANSGLENVRSSSVEPLDKENVQARPPNGWTPSKNKWKRISSIAIFVYFRLFSTTILPRKQISSN